MSTHPGVAAAGQPDRAEQLARTIPGPDRQAAALTAVAQALVAAGQPDRAERLARTITDPNRQAEVLTELAVVLAERDSTAVSTCFRRVIATSLTSSLWFKAMPVLALLAPTAVAAPGSSGDRRSRSLCLEPGLMETIKPTGSKIRCQHRGSTPARDR